MDYSRDEKDYSAMTLEEAMAHSLNLQMEVWLSIALRRPELERKEKLMAYIQFNPYMYSLEPIR